MTCSISCIPNYSTTTSLSSSLDLFHSTPIKPATMAALTNSSRTLLRALPRISATHYARCISTSDTKNAASYESPFKGADTSRIPDFGHYRSKSGSRNNLVFQYFMVGSMGALTAAGAKATVQGTLLLLIVRQSGIYRG